jgi:hypothetical protein
VELAVRRAQLARSVEEQRRIEAVFPLPFDKAAPQNPTVPPRRFPGEPLRNPSADGFGAAKQFFPVPAAGEDFGQRHEIGSARGGQLVREPGQIPVNVRPRRMLNHYDAERFRSDYWIRGHAGVVPYSAHHETLQALRKASVLVS